MIMLACFITESDTFFLLDNQFIKEKNLHIFPQMNMSVSSKLNLAGNYLAVPANEMSSDNSRYNYSL